MTRGARALMKQNELTPRVLLFARAAQIKHFVVLLMENRPIDHTFGCMAGEGIIGLNGINGTHDLPMDPDDPSNGTETVTCGTANYVCKNGPPMSMWNLHLKPGHPDAYPYVILLPPSPLVLPRPPGVVWLPLSPPVPWDP